MRGRTNIKGNNSNDNISDLLSNYATKKELKEVIDNLGGLVFGRDSSGNSGYYDSDGKFYPFILRYEQPYDIISWTKIEDGENYFEGENNTYSSKCITSEGLAYSKFCINNPFDYDIVTGISYVSGGGVNGVTCYTYIYLNGNLYFNISNYNYLTYFDKIKSKILKKSISKGKSYQIPIILKPGVNELDLYAVGTNREGYETKYTLNSLIRENVKKYSVNKYMWEQEQGGIFAKVGDDAWFIEANSDDYNVVTSNFITTIEDSSVYEFYAIGLTYSSPSYYIKISVNDKLIFNSYIGEYNTREMSLEVFSTPLIEGENKINISFRTYSNENCKFLLKLPPVIEEYVPQ